jgi:hypothetical protein
MVIFQYGIQSVNLKNLPDSLEIDSMCCSLEKRNEKMRIEKFILQHRGVLSLKFSKVAE